MGNVLEVKGLCKKYPNFYLDNVSFSLPQGHIMGFIGENGAGKSTTIKLLLDIIKRDRGEIKIFGRDNRENSMAIKQNIGIVFDESSFADTLNPANINQIMSGVYQNWDQALYFRYLKQFALPEKQELKSFSRGMKMKLSIAVALSHHPRFLILDEPTSGLDPIVRDEILDIFLEFIQDEKNSIFLSTHITSDIEKIADYITFIHHGQIVFVDSKDDLLGRYGVLKCGQEEFAQIDKSFVKGYRENKFGVEALVEKKEFRGNTIDPATIEDIMLFTVRGEKQ